MQAAQAPQIKASRIVLDWMKFPNEQFDYSKPMRVLVNGVIGSGKSAFLESLAEQYLIRGNNVADLYGTSAGEGLAWLRSPWVTGHQLSVLLIKGNTDVKCRWPVKHYEDVRLEDFEKNRIVISTTPLYNSRGEEYKADSELMKLFDKRIGYPFFIYGLIREAKYLVYARIKFDEATKGTKSTGIDLITQSRHHGFCLGLDSQRSNSIDLEIRDLLSYRIYKSMGNMTTSIDDYYYSFWRPQWVARMRPGQFGIISSTGNVGRGFNEYVTWHKRERENLLRALDIQVKYTEEKRRKSKEDKESDSDKP